jgi:hypothetical protein
VANKKEDEVVLNEEQIGRAPEIDIQKYLAKNPNAKSIDDMLKVLFRGQMKTETEWSKAIKEMLSRKV